jgi:hypothetical protein
MLAAATPTATHYGRPLTRGHIRVVPVARVSSALLCRGRAEGIIASGSHGPGEGVALMFASFIQCISLAALPYAAAIPPLCRAKRGNRALRGMIRTNLGGGEGGARRAGRLAQPATAEAVP